MIVTYVHNLLGLFSLQLIFRIQDILY